jgi:hypothetical protein
MRKGQVGKANGDYTRRLKREEHKKFVAAVGDGKEGSRTFGGIFLVS